MQVLQAAMRLSLAAHAEPCHWSEGCNNNVGVTAGKASHNASNASGVTAGKMGRNSSRANGGKCEIIPPAESKTEQQNRATRHFQTLSAIVPAEGNLLEEIRARIGLTPMSVYQY